jgi:hypothetical protein
MFFFNRVFNIVLSCSEYQETRSVRILFLSKQTRTSFYKKKQKSVGYSFVKIELSQSMKCTERKFLLDSKSNNLLEVFQIYDNFMGQTWKIIFFQIYHLLHNKNYET